MLEQPTRHDNVYRTPKVRRQAQTLVVTEALELAVARTRQLSRRQRMWFRRDPRITWLGTGGEGEHSNPLALLPALLATWTA